MSVGSILSLLGGVGLFLFGMTIMSTGLKNACGDNLQLILEKATKNRVIAVLVGLGMTMLIQSSSATDVMVIGFVNSGFMNLTQAIGVIMGANIGTTITAQITAFNISTFTPLLIFLGAVLYLFIKKNIVRHVGSIIMGFGILFQGITIMKAAILPLSDSEPFINFLTTLSNPVLAVLFGVGFTALLQSSSSSIVIFQAFAVSGLIDYRMAVYLVIGAAIGSVTPNILASLTANNEGKRTAILNLLFNLIRAGIILLLITLIPGILDLLQSLSPGDVGRQIANTHTIFAIVAVLIELPFAPLIVKLTYRIFPKKPKETKALEDRKLIYMNQNANLPPAMAINLARMEIARMNRFAIDNLIMAIQCFFNYDVNLADQVEQTEETVNILNHSISQKLSDLKGMDISSENLRKISMLTIALTDIERISDHAENIVEYAESLKAKKATISGEALSELRAMSEKVVESLEVGLDIFTNDNYDRLGEIENLENVVDTYEATLINNHIERLMKSKCDPLGGVIFSELITDFERCADHAVNIAYALKERPKELWAGTGIERQLQ